MMGLAEMKRMYKKKMADFTEFVVGVLDSVVFQSFSNTAPVTESSITVVLVYMQAKQKHIFLFQTFLMVSESSVFPPKKALLCSQLQSTN